jgi:hypothetical protein
MIDIALKHFIYDICIDVVFSKICNNFNFNLVDPIKLKKGDTCSSIHISTLYYGGDKGHDEYYGCWIIDVSSTLIKFTYSSGKEYMGDGLMNEWNAHHRPETVFIDNIIKVIT